jgi:hypothetical protein
MTDSTLLYDVIVQTEYVTALLELFSRVPKVSEVRRIFDSKCDPDLVRNARLFDRRAILKTVLKGDKCLLGQPGLDTINSIPLDYVAEVVVRRHSWGHCGVLVSRTVGRRLRLS